MERVPFRAWPWTPARRPLHWKRKAEVETKLLFHRALFLAPGKYPDFDRMERQLPQRTRLHAEVLQVPL